MRQTPLTADRAAEVRNRFGVNRLPSERNFPGDQREISRHEFKVSRSAGVPHLR